MQRDKKGRFVKKAFDGTVLTFNGNKYKVKPGATQAFAPFQGQYNSINDWLVTDEGLGYLEPVNEPNTTSLNSGTTTTTSTLGTQTYKPLSLGTFNINNPLDNTAKIKYTKKDGKLYDLSGNELSFTEVMGNLDKYEMVGAPSVSTAGTSGEDIWKNAIRVPNAVKFTIGGQQDPTSSGMNLTNPGADKGNLGDKLLGAVGSLDKNKMAGFLDFIQAGVGASINNKIAERALEAEKPFLQDVSESHRQVFGDYRAKIEGEKAAARLRNMASKPLTSDGALQQQMMLDAQIKGQEYIDQGNAKDDALIKQTREVAWQQDKENQQQRQAVAMQNRQAMLMSQKNKTAIENARDSANFSQIVKPLMAQTSAILRQKGSQQEAYNDYYKNALTEREVWNTFDEGLTPEQKNLKNIFLTQGIDGVNKYTNSDPTKEAAWNQLQSIIQAEIIRRQAALRGVFLNKQSLLGNTAGNPYAMWEPSTPISYNKKGGTIYKAKLKKRIKDNDRAAHSIESSKKIAARFLEKVMDSLYTYDDVEIVAKPGKKSRKYQAGGGLPFVSFTPTFGTSEKGAPLGPTKKADTTDLTSKDVLKLLDNLDGLPTDTLAIASSLRNFRLQNDNDPLNLISSSNIASQYISLLSKIKVAKFNREEYNQAFNQLKGNGGLHELAITSEGLLIGKNKEGDFEFFTPDQVNAGDPSIKGYSLLTNSNLLYERAQSPEAAFNHQLITFAQNGIGMEVITKHVNDVISSLGTTKESEEGFVQMGNKGQVKAGLSFLQKAAKAVNDAGITDNMSIADYYQAGYLTEDQAQQAQLALQYLWSALPTNAKSLLQVKGGSPKGAEALLQSIVFAKTSNEIQFKATPKKMTKTGSGSKSSGNDALKLTPVQMMQVGYTDHMPVTLQKGTKYATVVNAQVLPITDVNKKTLGITTLDKVAESTFAGALDMNNVTMGSQLIDPHAMQNVQIDSTNLYVMNLPIDKNSPDGTIRPDLAWMTKIEEIDKVIRDQGITDINMINKLYQEAGLPVLMDSNGQLNTKDYCKFGVLNGHALNSAFKNLDLLDNTMLEIDDEDQINNVLSILNNGRSEKDRIDFDSKSWADSIFGTDHDTLYEGTIYIPVRTNAFMGMIGGGAYPDVDEAAEVEALIQQKERTRGYVDPGLLN